jgi:hypothetical protein
MDETTIAIVDAPVDAPANTESINAFYAFLSTVGRYGFGLAILQAILGKDGIGRDDFIEYVDRLLAIHEDCITRDKAATDQLPSLQRLINKFNFIPNENLQDAYRVLAGSQGGNTVSYAVELATGNLPSARTAMSRLAKVAKSK